MIKLVEHAGEAKYWFDARQVALEPVRGHHWSDVEDDPAFFADFGEDEEWVTSGEADDRFLRDVVLSNGWVRVTVSGDIEGNFEGRDVSEIRSALNAVLNEYPLENAYVEIGESQWHLDRVQMTQFLKSGNLPQTGLP